MLLSTNKLSYTINGKHILYDVTLNIPQGSFMGMMGPNGAGKTTLIKILSGVIRDYDGVATLNQMQIKKMKPRGLARFVAVVPQECYFSFSFSALEVVLMGRHPFQKHFAFESIEDLQTARMAMEKTDCWQFADRFIETLSGGEKQRVLLARALAQEPKILLLDEPASHLDLKHQQDLYRLLKELNQQEGLTILCVAHDLNTAAQYCRSIAFLKGGELAKHGSVAQMLDEKIILEVFGVRCRVLDTGKGRMVYAL